MGPFVQSKPKLWEPEVVSQYREPPPPHVGHRIRGEDGWSTIGWHCDTCGWETRDRRRWRSNWWRHQNEVTRLI